MQTSETGTRASWPTTDRAAPRDDAGFTLVELMATVAVLGLLLALFVPGLGPTRSAALRSQARDRAAHLELARQRAVMTGKPHRVLVALEDGSYQLEWLATESDVAPQDPDAAAPPPPQELDLRGEAPVPLSPPRDETREFRPIPNRFGSREWLDDDFHFEGVENADGFVDRGFVSFVFDRDGTTDAAQIAIADEDGNLIFLEVRPLLDVVRIHYAES
jgi:prepilin-type N-terminal cleavage/methylation domain-containing protein